uniref:Uncharacterized protein n=1 Tax=Romanomermis culicivorax TaxID=13658 RepID=A0A915JFC9_ROMCU
MELAGWMLENFSSGNQDERTEITTTCDSARLNGRGSDFVEGRGQMSWKFMTFFQNPFNNLRIYIQSVWERVRGLIGERNIQMGIPAISLIICMLPIPEQRCKRTLTSI